MCEGVSGNEEKCAGICVRVCEGVSLYTPLTMEEVSMSMSTYP